MARGSAGMVAAYAVQRLHPMERERDPELDRSPELFGFIAELLIVVGTIFALGIFRC